MTNLTPHYLFNRDRFLYDRWKPHLVFEYVITTHKFNPTNYSIHVSHRENLHKEIMKLHELGWGYTKIHRHLRENGFQIGKSLNQPTYKSGFQDFRVEVFEC